MSLCNVNIGTGDVYHFSVDLFLRGLIPFRFIRDYDSGRQQNSILGQLWKHNHSHLLVLRDKLAVYVKPDGSEIAIRHPDYPLQENSTAYLATRRVGDTIYLSDLENTVYSFERLKAREDLFFITSHSDPRGNRIEYRYDPDGVLNSVKDSCGRLVIFVPDGAGRISRVLVDHPQVSKSRLELVRYEYDRDSNLREVRDRNGGVNHFNYKGHLLAEHINPLGGRTYFKYDFKGRCIHTYREDGSHERTLVWKDAEHGVDVRDSRGAVWCYTLNQQNRPLLEVDPLGREKEYVYDDAGNLQFVNDQHMPQTVTLFFEESKLLINQTGPVANTFQYDDKMRLIEQVSPAGAKWVYKYDDRSNRVEIIDPAELVWRFKYDSDGWLSAAQDPRGFHFQRTRKNPFDVEYQDEIGVNALLRYTPFGLLAGTVDGLGNVTSFEYKPTDLISAIHYADGSQVRFQHDAMGNMTRVETESGAVTSFEYDPFGAPVSVINPLGYRGRYRYDSEGNLVEISNFKGEVAKLEYDLMNQAVATTLFDGRSHTYRYDPRGGVSSVHDRNQQLLVEVARDELGRIVEKKFPGGWVVSYEWGDQSQLLSARNQHATVRIEWTLDLRVAAEHVNDFSVFYEYDEVGNRKLLSTSTGREIEYFWDARNRLTKILDNGRAEYQFSYDDGNLFREWVCPSIVQRYAFDIRQRMTRREALERKTETVVASRQFKYDMQGRLIDMQDQQRGGFQYRYSDIEAILDVRSANGSDSESYDFDANENLTLMRGGQRITYSAGNRLAQAGQRTFEHDRDGGVTKIAENGREWILAYNHEGQLASVRTPEGKFIEYQYDPLGRRLRKIIGDQTTHFFWDQGAHLSEVLPSGENIDYLFLPQTLIPLGMTNKEGHYSFILDQAGTPTEITDSNGELAWSGDYTAFGELRAERVSRIRNPFRFQGQYFDEETGFHYNFFRYYYPPCARYLSQDPLGLMAGANVYRYVLNPFNWVDPFGLNNLVNGVLKITPICGWSAAQNKDARKKMLAMNSKLGNSGITIPEEPVQRCGAGAKDIYEDCQKKAKEQGKAPPRNLNEGGGKCHNEQADHILEICAGGGEKDCDNLQPLNESVNKSYGSQVAAAVRQNPGAVLKAVVLLPRSQCRPSAFQC